MAYLASPLLTTSLFMVWSALGGHFDLSNFRPALFFCCVPHLGATISWIPFVVSREPARFGRLFYLGAGAASGLVTALVGAALSFGLLQAYLAFTITGAVSALIFREIAVMRDQTI
jgi:hypothetical protein